MNLKGTPVARAYPKPVKWPPLPFSSSHAQFSDGFIK